MRTWRMRWLIKRSPKPKTITQVLDYPERDVFITNQYSHGLQWMVMTRPKKKDWCCGCFLSRQSHCGVYCKNFLSGHRSGHFKRIREGDILKTERGKKFKVIFDGVHMKTERM